MLKNTEWIIGLVVFTGNDTKLMKNSKYPPHKRSNIEKRINKYLSFVFTVLFTIAILSASISIAFAYTNEEIMKFFSGDSLQASPLVFVTFLILYNSLVPISLYVTLDVVKMIQSKFIQWDLLMYCDEYDQPAIVKTGDLNEDLGQIEYIFTDKTGTLTQNIMEFKRCSIKGCVYGFNEHQDTFKKSQLNPHKKLEF